MLERRAVPLAHQEPDEALVAFVEFVRPRAERDAGRVDDGQVVAHVAVEPDEAVAEHVDPGHEASVGVVGTNVDRSHAPSVRTQVPATPYPDRV